MTVKNRIYTITITINAVDSEGNVAARSAVAGIHEAFEKNHELSLS